MQPVGIEFDFGAVGASAEEIDGAAAAHHFHRPLPGLGTSHGLDDHVGTAAFSQVNYVFDRVAALVDLHHVVGAKALGGVRLLFALDHRDHFAAAQLGHLHEHQAQRPRAHHGHRVADIGAGFL